MDSKYRSDVNIAETRGPLKLFAQFLKITSGSVITKCLYPVTRRYLYNVIIQCFNPNYYMLHPIINLHRDLYIWWCFSALNMIAICLG